jgi:CRP-like cAMP-binding protein
MDERLGPLANKLLAALPHEDFSLLQSHLTIVPLLQGTLLFDAEDEVDRIFFPLSGMISLLLVLENGNAVEIATVGREGVVGGMAGLGPHKSQVRAVTQLSGAVARVPAIQFRRLAQTRSVISDLCIRYNETLLAQARITAACNLSHLLEARFCRWLLQTRDCAESDTVPLTHEYLAEMLGVRRTSVTEIAIKMHGAGIIDYSRGVIQIIDLPKLKELSCECYESLLRAHS